MPKAFKILIPVIIVIIIVANSCGKICGCDLPKTPPQLSFEVVDKNGNSLVSSLNDAVTVTYLNNGQENQSKTISLTVKKNYTSFPDTNTVSSKYNGFYIDDSGQLGTLSRQTPAVSTFNLNINGKSAGVIYVNYNQYQANYPNLTTAAFTFNNMPVTYDHSTSVGLELLQLQ